MKRIKVLPLAVTLIVVAVILACYLIYVPSEKASNESKAATTSDCPKPNDKLSNNIYKCLVGIINESLDNEVDVPSPNDIYIGYKKSNHSNRRYKGNIRDVNAIGRFASERYFAIQKAEYGDDPQSLLINCLSLRQC